MFELNSDNKVIIAPEFLVIKEFSELWERDKTKAKDSAFRELSFVYFISDYKSPYRIAYGTEQLQEVLVKDFIKDTTWKPDKKIVEAIKKYKELQQTPAMKALDIAYKGIEKCYKYVENINIEASEDPNGTMKTVMDFVKKLGETTLSLNIIKEKIEKELTEKKHNTRGAGELRSRELPKLQRKN